MKCKTLVNDSRLVSRMSLKIKRQIVPFTTFSERKGKPLILTLQPKFLFLALLSSLTK